MKLAPDVLDAMILRVRSATCPTPEIDVELMAMLLPRHKKTMELGFETLVAVPWEWRDGAWRVTERTPYTASIDCARGLLHGSLPGWLWRVASCCVTDDAWVCPDFNDPVHGAALLQRFEKRADGRDPSEAIMEATDVARHPAGQPALAFIESILLGLRLDAEYPAEAAP